MPLTPLPTRKIEYLARTLTSAQGRDQHDLAATRRGLLLAPLLAALPAALLSDPAHAIDPNQTQVTLPDQVQWGGMIGDVAVEPGVRQNHL